MFNNISRIVITFLCLILVFSFSFAESTPDEATLDQVERIDTTKEYPEATKIEIFSILENDSEKNAEESAEYEDEIEVEEYDLERDEVFDAYTNVNLNIREFPSTKSTIISRYRSGDIFTVAEYGNENWYKTFVDNETYYVSKEFTYIIEDIENYSDEELEYYCDLICNMTVENMSSLPIYKIGMLNCKSVGYGVTTKSDLNFKGIIPIYEIIYGYAYVPSGRNIYKIPLECFEEITDVGDDYTFLAAYRSVYYSSSENRKFNIEKVSKLIDGTVINPEETFSFNKITGPRGEKEGYKLAKVIANGKYVDGYGGGVCQVASTIYSAILNNYNIQIEKRYAHALEVNYVPIDMDATVNYNNIDFSFTNYYEFPIRVNVISENGICLVVISKAN